jgi:hypothetical protein
VAHDVEFIEQDLAAREAALFTASLRKVELLKIRADAELAFAEKGLAAAKTDQAKARAEDLKQKAAVKVAELQCASQQSRKTGFARAGSNPDPRPLSIRSSSNRSILVRDF